MRVFTDLLMKNSAIVLNDSQDFPGSPRIGEFCFTGGILYIYATVNTVTTWFPLTNRINYHVHSQGVSALTWSIAHNLGTNDLIFMVYNDADEIQLTADVTFVDVNNITIEFTESTKGRAIIFSANGGVAGGDAGGGGDTPPEVIAHLTDTSNPHVVTATQVGLGNVTNNAQVRRNEMGVASGVATLDATGKVNAAQLPVDVSNVAYALSGTNVTVDGANGSTQTLALTGASSVSFEMPPAGTTYSIRLLVQQAVGSYYDINWTGVKWPGGTIPVITATDGAEDIIAFLVTSTQVYGAFNQNFV